MNISWKAVIWPQFGAAIDMLENALRACPDELWRERLWADAELPESAEFWYLVYHTLFWLDLYLSGRREGFAPPAPFTLDELDPAGVLPEKPYARDELHSYLAYCRRKGQAVFDALTDEKAGQRTGFRWVEDSFAELQLYNMRHVQEHVAQLNMLLGQKTGSAPGWVARAKRDG
ncbi:MAG: DinB family protein [Anaerolineae bacterium]